MTPPRSERLRFAFAEGQQARRFGMTIDEVHTYVAGRYKTRERRRAYLDGWLAEDRERWWDNLPKCPVCFQPCAPPETEADRTWLHHDHPWHHDQGLELPHE